ncbi:MAG: hypothetical protein Q8N88_03665 [Nanoarchaeota archaeon]|nr:hypothetical protein [Nanoarchaeota archaeon]
METKLFTSPDGTTCTLEGFKILNEHYYSKLIKQRILTDKIEDKKKRKIIETICNCENGVFTIGVPDWESGFNGIYKPHLVKMLIEQDFDYELSYADDFTILIIRFKDKTFVKNVWNKSGQSIEIYLDRRDFIELKGLGENNDCIIEKIIKECDFEEEIFNYYKISNLK